MSRHPCALRVLYVKLSFFFCTVTNAGARHRTSVEWSACAAWRPGGGASRSLRAHIRKHSGEAQVCGTVSLDTVSVATYYACKSCRSAIPNAQRYPPAARVRAVSGDENDIAKCACTTHIAHERGRCTLHVCVRPLRPLVYTEAQSLSDLTWHCHESII